MITLAITEEGAKWYLKRYLQERCRYWQIQTVTRLEGLNYWAFNVYIPPLYNSFLSKLNGAYGFHVYDDGMVKMVAHYPDEK